MQLIDITFNEILLIGDCEFLSQREDSGWEHFKLQEDKLTYWDSVNEYWEDISKSGFTNYCTNSTLKLIIE